MVGKKKKESVSGERKKYVLEKRVVEKAGSVIVKSSLFSFHSLSSNK